MSSAHIRRMAPSGPDPAFGIHLATQAGWNQTAADWRRFLDLNPDGCLLAEDDGVPAGTGVVVRHGTLAWIAMVLVDARHRRRGIGRAIVQACIRQAHAGGASLVGLDATPAGRPLYQTLGFIETGRLARWEGSGGTYGCAGVRAMTAEDLVDVSGFDRPAFGADRSRWLARLQAEAPELAFVHRDAAGRVAGYILGRTGSQATQLGPWLAADRGSAEQLLRAALDAVGAGAVYLDIPEASETLAARYGFEVQRPFARMMLAGTPSPGASGVIRAAGGPDLG